MVSRSRPSDSRVMRKTVDCRVVLDTGATVRVEQVARLLGIQAHEL